MLLYTSLVPASRAEGADVRLVFWYDRARPLDTFKFQPYDLRKKEFTPEVEWWVARMKKDYPGYAAYTRDLDLARERGETDNLKIGSAILREFYVLGDRHGYMLGGYTGTTGGPTVGVPGPVGSGPLRTFPHAGAQTVYPGVPGLSPPFPVPYPRPHP